MVSPQAAVASRHGGRRLPEKDLRQPARAVHDVFAGDDGHGSHVAALRRRTPARIVAVRGRVTGSLPWTGGGGGQPS